MVNPNNAERKSIFESQVRLQAFRRGMERLRRSDKDLYEIIDDLVFETKELRKRVDKLENYILESELSMKEEMNDGK